VDGIATIQDAAPLRSMSVQDERGIPANNPHNESHALNTTAFDPIASQHRTDA
jgi:hypothetical protein